MFFQALTALKSTLDLIRTSGSGRTGLEVVELAR